MTVPVEGRIEGGTFLFKGPFDWSNICVVQEVFNSFRFTIFLFAYLLNVNLLTFRRTLTYSWVVDEANRF